MPVLYFDTSALVKRYYREQGHDKVKRIVGVPSNDVVLSNIGAAEIASVLRKKVREQELSEQNARLRLARFIYDGQNAYDLFPVTAKILGDSIGLVSKHELRSLDSIHLATARRIRRDSGTFQFVTCDEDLFNAADEEGMRPIDPSGQLP